MGGCFFNYLIKVTPHCVVLCLNRPFLSDERPVCMFPRSPLLRQRPNPPPPPPASTTSVQPSVLVPSALARSEPDPTFVNPIILASSDISRPDTDPASVPLETACHIAPAAANCAAARTSSLLAPQLASTKLQPALETCSFVFPAPAGSYPIAHIANIAGGAMSSVPYIDTFIKG